MKLKKIDGPETRQLLESLKRIVETVDDAINKNAEQAAFFCSLSIPDVAGQIEFPKLRGNNKVGKRYVKWYDINVYEYENPKYEDPIKQNRKKLNQVDGKVMYLIRCKLYHQGDYLHQEVKDILSKKYGENVELNIEFTSKARWVSISSNNMSGVKNVDIGLDMLDLARKLKWNAEGTLREYGYLPME